MPIHKIQGGYQYGKTGKKYYGKDAKKRAKAQELAIRLSGYKEPSKRKTVIHDSTSTEIGRVFVEELLTKG